MADKLKQGISSFIIVGKARVDGKDYLSDPQMNKKNTWESVRTGFVIELDDTGNNVYVTISGGYSPSSGIIKKLPRSTPEGEEFKMLEIPYNSRFQEELIKEVQYSELYSSSLSGERKQYVLAQDFLKDIQENLHNGDEIVVRGTVEYSWDMYGEGRVYKNFNINNIYPNDMVEDKDVTKESGEKVMKLRNKKQAILEQTYLVDSHSLPDGWERTLDKGEDVELLVKVPQFVSKARNPETGDYDIELKQNIAIPQTVIARYPEGATEESKKKFKRVMKSLFHIKDEDRVRDIALSVSIHEGYETQTGDIEIDENMQMLIDMGSVNMEEIEKAVTIRGDRISELVFRAFVIRRNRETGEIYNLMDLHEYTIKDTALPPLSEVSGDITSGLFDGDDDGVISMSNDDFLDEFALDELGL